MAGSQPSTKPYKQLLKAARPKLGLRVPILLKLGRWWYFHIPKKGDGFTLYCPPYHPAFKPTFLHYLCHAKILEDGWRRPKIKSQLTKKDIAKIKRLSKKERDGLLFGWINRTADSFFDFYAWALVAEVFGKQYFMRFTDGIAKAKAAELIKDFKQMYTQTGFRYTAFATCLDWFAMFHALAGRIDGRRQKQLAEAFKGLSADRRFLRLVPLGTKQKIAWIRQFYSNLSARYPSYRELLADSQHSQMHFAQYYKHVWKGTGLDAKVVGFV